MLFWMSLIVVLFLLCILGLYLGVHKNDNWFYLSIVTIVIACTFLLAVPISRMQYKMQINQFQQQSSYMITHVPKNEIEDAALTAEKVKMNAWLYNAQWFKRTYRWISLFPDSILELKPIQ